MSTIHVVASRPGRLLLCKIGNGPVFWHDRNHCECLNYRYTLQAPSREAAEALAETYDGVATTVDNTLPLDGSVRK